jgi:acyl-CoA hydrolase
MVNRAYLVLVALDQQGKPAPVPGLITVNGEERAEWEAGIKRRALREQRRASSY